MSLLEGASFIKPDREFHRDYSEHDPAPLFRRRFSVKKKGEAVLEVCALGYGYFYLNGRPVSDDLFVSAVSDYRKTLWVHRYDVSDLLHEGENVFAAVLGNGFFNESFQTPWKHHLAPWRDNPKMILRLTVGGKTVLVSDGGFLCRPASFVTFNQLRSGEHFDARLYDKRWKECGFDDAGWEHARTDERPPEGVFRLCECEPIRACSVYPARTVRKTGENTYLFDIGQNIAGVPRLTVCEPCGTVLTVRCAEEADEEGKLKLNGLNVLYPQVPFQTDRLICDGDPIVWQPMFTYHGFRFIEVEGFTQPPQIAAAAGVFVHQTIERLTEFSCSDPVLNKIYECGILATYSNLHYALTDCPTREKLGWLNDAQASAEQMCINFGIGKFFRKWMVDIFDAMREDGAMPGIAPSPDWGYDNGPVADGALFEIPYRLYLYTGEDALLKEAYPWFKRYLAFYTKCEKEGVRPPLADWNGLGNLPTPVEMIQEFYGGKFFLIAAEAAALRKEEDAAFLRREAERRRVALKEKWLGADGRCTVEEQTAVALLIAAGAYDSIAPLKKQLVSLFRQKDGHIDCGMVGTQYIFDALTACGETELAVHALTVRGEPGYRAWLDRGATTLWETWRDQFTDSRNHHMFSCVLGWMFKTLGGIRVSGSGKGFAEAVLDPQFPKQLSGCTAARKLAHGELRVHWERTEGKVRIRFDIPQGVSAVWRGRQFSAGRHEFISGEE